MKTSIEENNKWLKKLEDINFEFKKAENQFSRDKDLPNYCAALANEGGGKLLLDVTWASRFGECLCFQNVGEDTRLGDLP